MPEEKMEEDISSEASDSETPLSQQVSGQHGVSSESEPVELLPFSHQVSGHTCVLRFNETTLCKPLITREHHFYESVPSELQEFLPDYRGIIEVQLQEDSDGYMSLLGYPVPPDRQAGRPPSQESSPKFDQRTAPTANGSGNDDSASQNVKSARTSPKGSASPNSYSVRLLRSGSLEISTQTEQIFHSTDHKSSQKTAGLNPWSLRCHKKQLVKMRMDNQDSDHCKFILLENVVAQFESPCILDLKMGTRQHGDDAPEAKRKSMMRKCASSTSGILGVRMCGMQVYQISSGQFVCQNKYFGRTLTVEGFRQALELFLNNGLQLRYDLLDPILHRLRRLYKVVQNQDTFRFYSSSLLILYDGKAESAPVSTSVGPSESNDNLSSSSRSDQGNHRVHHASQTSRVPRTDVKMIDFAHSTHRGFEQDKQVHKGADQGYLFGLENLIKMFEDIKGNHDSVTSRCS